jgi:hypothetical protein
MSGGGVGPSGGTVLLFTVGDPDARDIDAVVRGPLASELIGSDGIYEKKYKNYLLLYMIYRSSPGPITCYT